MKIVITGGGSGGHFYPLMAVADAILQQAREQTLVEPRLYYIGPDEYNPKELFERGIQFIRVPAGKRRVNPSGVAIINNFIDLFKMGIGCVVALVKMFTLFPDVVFAKGGYASFPTLLAAKILGIPVIIHESDSVPGRVNAWAAKFAKRVAVSFKESAEYFDAKKTAFTGNPVRKEISNPLQTGALEYLELDKDLPVITVLGGSQGSKRINDLMMRTIPELTKKYQIIHQTGKSHFEIVSGMSKLALDGATHPERYKPIGYLSTMVIRMVAGVSNIIITRAGSGIFEIAVWGVPSILIPITDSHGDHQRKNAYNYARTGAGVVIEEANLTPQILIHEIETIIQNQTLRDQMSAAAKEFARTDAADVIAKEVINLALKHEV
ncbi:MAG: UDP-N-acetylglucosamine--N-acetylmuramyl-(pentapeptide) pyrophosphoryl-undecaprenol N-acetylglucosamine transferase [Patescibacteria group bacterium]